MAHLNYDSCHKLTLGNTENGISQIEKELNCNVTYSFIFKIQELPESTYPGVEIFPLSDSSGAGSIFNSFFLNGYQVKKVSDRQSHSIGP